MSATSWFHCVRAGNAGQVRMRSGARTPTLVWLIVLLWVVNTPMAGTASQATGPGQEHEDSSSSILLQFSQDIGVRDADRTPRVRVYDDFRVAVHFPVYMRRAGDYELELNDADMPRLYDTLVSVLNFDPLTTEEVIQRMEADARAAAFRENRPVPVSDWSDATTTIIEVDVRDREVGFEPSTNAAGGKRRAYHVSDPIFFALPRFPADSVRYPHRVAWADLQNQAERFPQIDALQRLAAAERWLVDLSNDERLVAVERTPD